MSNLLLKEIEDGVISPSSSDIGELLGTKCYEINKHSYRINGGDHEYLHLECKNCGLIYSYMRKLMIPTSVRMWWPYTDSTRTELVASYKESSDETA